MKLAFLKKLVYCHSTPGDEHEVFTALSGQWRSLGWYARPLGRYALLAERPSLTSQAATILLCAHADSPGYIVDTLRNSQGTAVPLGSPGCNQPSQRVIAKTAAGKIPLILSAADIAADSTAHSFQPVTGLQRGDRLAFVPSWRRSSDGRLQAPFLDNRVGCFLLAQLAEILPPELPVNIVLAVTGGEEFTGFGASVLAQAIAADLVICLDATYSSTEQGISLGGGPVLTLSDRSVLICPEVHQALAALCVRWDIPLQVEIYNYSGTDARAFPQAGNTALVLPLLIASEGNHTAKETIDTADLLSCLALLTRICTDLEALPELLGRVSAQEAGRNGRD